MTEKEGKFKFDQLNAGTYHIELVNSSDESYTLHKEHNKLTCLLDWKSDNKCVGQLVVSGYTIRSKIASESHSLDSFTVFLYPK